MFCAGDSELYTVDMLTGPNTYHWFIDGLEVTTTPGPNYTHTWPTPGTYQLCVDASNDPCVPVTDPPPQNCLSIDVYDAASGTISITPSTLCPGETTNINVSGQSTTSEYAHVILVTTPAGIVEEIHNISPLSLSVDSCDVFSICSFSYVIANGPVPVIGDDINTYDCPNLCCDLDCQTLTFEDEELPVFVNPPSGLTLDCLDDLPAMMDLQWTDNCDGTGMVSGVEMDLPANACIGGTVTRTWTYSDACNNTATHDQIITIDPAPLPAFTTLPSDMTVSCDLAPTGPAVDLFVTNNAMGACLIDGPVIAMETGTADLCGGFIIYLWEYTDLCGRTISHSQTITVDPPPATVFNSLPANMTVDCDMAPTGPAMDLDYSNGAAGSCHIFGSVSPSEMGSADECGGSFTYMWSYTDVCMETITHTQIITVDPTPIAAFDMLPGNMTVSCDMAPTGPAMDLNYTNNETGSCLIMGSESPNEMGSADECGGMIIYTWQYTDACNRTISHTQTITVDAAPEAVFDNLPTDMTVSCDMQPTGPPQDLNYSNSDMGMCLIEGADVAEETGLIDLCGGDLIYTWDFTDDCGRNINHAQTITVEPAPDPSFDNFPMNMIVDCNAVPPSPGPLPYTNGATGACEISGSANPVISGSYDECGGSLVYTWTYMDACHLIEHTQTIDVNPAPMAAFTSMPADITVNCDAVPTSSDVLLYMNNESGTCEISGSVMAVQTGSYNACGGVLLNTWEFTDDCGRTISYAQEITVLPASEASFSQLPADMTVACSDVPVLIPSISYTNGESGTCEISGAVQAVVSGTFDYCGGSVIYTWNFTDDCGRPITHEQTLTVEPAPDAVFIDPPADITLACQQIYVAQPLAFSNSAAGLCELSGTEVPFENVVADGLEYVWYHTNPCNGNMISHVQHVAVSIPPDISIDNDLVFICEGASYDLADIIITDLNNTNFTVTYHAGLIPTNQNILSSTIVTPTTNQIYSILMSNEFDCIDYNDV